MRKAGPLVVWGRGVPFDDDVLSDAPLLQWEEVPADSWARRYGIRGFWRLFLENDDESRIFSGDTDDAIAWALKTLGGTACVGHLA